MRTAIDIRNVREDIRSHVNADAEKRGVSVNDVVGEILASRYGIPFVPTGYPYQGGSDSDHWNLRLSTVIRDAVRAHAEAVGGTSTGCILFALADHYGLDPISPKRRSGWPGLDPEMVTTARQRNEAGESIRSLSREYRVKRETLAKAIRSGGGA
jgi:hypothetical protein